MMHVGPCGQPLQSASCMQRVAQVPFTHWSRAYEQSVSSAHSEMRRQSGWQMPASQKSWGLGQLSVQFGWQVALMHVLFAGQSVLKMHCGVGVGFFSQIPPKQKSPVPQPLSSSHGKWQRPTLRAS